MSVAPAGSRDKHLKLWAVDKESAAVNAVPLRNRLEEARFASQEGSLSYRVFLARLGRPDILTVVDLQALSLRAILSALISVTPPAAEDSQ